MSDEETTTNDDASAHEEPRGDSLEVKREDEREPGDLTHLGPWRGFYDGTHDRLGQYCVLQAPVTIITSDDGERFAEAGSVLFYDGDRYTGFSGEAFSVMADTMAVLGERVADGAAPILAQVAAGLMEPSQASDADDRQKRNANAARHAADAAEALLEELHGRGAVT